MRKLHIGGKIRVEGWEVLNAVPMPCVDHVGDAGDLSRFETGTFGHLYASHVLEHFDYEKQIFATLAEWCRVLVPGGMLHVSVPDLDILARMFCDREKFNAHDRFLTMRMIFGGHTDKYDYHLVGLNEEFLSEYLIRSGFTNVVRVPELGIFYDSSKTELRGVQISLNMTAVKR
jgi:predicted SAM-dependent methyltransferase